MSTVKYVLPEKLRETLKQPLGSLVENDELYHRLETIKGKIVTIGDLVTATIIRYGLKPLFCIVDYRTKRNEVTDEIKNFIQGFGDEVIEIENPPGTITEEIWDTIEEIYRERRGNIRIEVKGEEDLTALPAIYLAPRDVTIIYGLPDKGVVIVNPDEKTKQKVKNILSEM